MMGHLKRFRSAAAGLVLTGIALMGCATIPWVAPASQGTPLEETFWLLESYVDLQGGTHTVLPRTQVTIAFQDGKISGSDGCNQYFGTYSLEGSKLTITPEGSTMMACPELIMTQAAAFTAGLSSTAAYEIQGKTLTLKNAEGGMVMVLQASPQELVGTRWQAIAVNNGKQAVVSLIEGTEITAEFDAEGTVFGSAGCNQYNGPYEFEGKQIAIGPLATTRKACPQTDGAEVQEAAYLAALGSSVVYELVGTNLTRRDAQGATQVEFIKP
jgi:heat shock protein HslJ